MDKTVFSTYHTFEEADEADRQERWAMTVGERLELLEHLRSFQYPDGKTPPRFQRILEFVEFKPR